MALERKDLTQIVTFDPPLPRRAFGILAQGTTTSADNWGGSSMDGKTFGYFLIDTTWWTASQGVVGDLNLLPMPVGTKFNMWTDSGTMLPFDPTPYLINQYNGAPDLINMNAYLNHAIVPKNTTLKTVVGVRQAAANQWYVYYSVPDVTVYNTLVDGIVTWPTPSNPQWMGEIGHVTGLSYNWSKPGGPTSLQFTLTCPPTFRTTGMNIGRRLQAWRGGSCIWDGTLEEPTASPTGWTIVADGTGTEGENFAATYSTWTPDNVINDAIGRGLRWRNDGIGQPQGVFGLNSSNAWDPGSQTVTDFLNLLCQTGSLYWSIEPSMSVQLPGEAWVLRIRPFPTDISGNPLSAGTASAEQYNVQDWGRIDLKANLKRLPPDLYILNSVPISRTTNGTYNTLVLKYQVTPDIPATSTKAEVPATYGLVVVDQPTAVAGQSRIEYFLDLTSAGVMTQAQVQVMGQALLQRYVKLSYTTAYTVTPGRLITSGGEPVDLACDYSGKIATVWVENAPVGGDVTASPLTFFIADYAYDDDSATATITPYQDSNRGDIQSLLAEMYPNTFG